MLIEADVCGRGPSGRNGGFCNEMWFHMGSMRDRYGDEGAVALGRASTASVEEIGRFCDEQEVDAWFRHSRLSAGVGRACPGRCLGPGGPGYA